MVFAIIAAGIMLTTCRQNTLDLIFVPRDSTLVVDTTENVDTTVVVDNSYRDHKTYFMLNTHTVGTGVAIVFVGDGFDREDNRVGGPYETVCRELADKFLSNPIIRDFREWFDIYAVVAESAVSGIAEGDFFNSSVSADFEAANAFTCEAVPGLAAITKRSWIFIGHGMIGGFANFGVNGDCGSGVYSTAEGVSGYWMAHEFVGHAFASLADEYDAKSFGAGYYGGPPSLLSYQSVGMCLNLSTVKEPENSPWAAFAGREGYEEVGMYVGGWSENRGIWRPEEWSIMVGNNYGNEGDAALYYNAPSRWLIYKRIHDCAGVACTIDEFFEFDKAYNVK